METLKDNKNIALQKTAYIVKYIVEHLNPSLYNLNRALSLSAASSDNPTVLEYLLDIIDEPDIDTTLATATLQPRLLPKICS